MGDAVEQYLNDETGSDRKRRQALAAWEHYRATGLHVTEVEADTWLAQLEAGTKADPPKPHS